jgi:hypothetical protein
LLVKLMIWFLPISDFLITNLLEFKVDIVIIVLFSYYIVIIQLVKSFVCDLYKCMFIYVL